MEIQSLRGDNTLQIISSFRGQNQSSSEVNQQIGQLALKLRKIEISESEQISALQQIIILAVSASDSPSVARESGVIEAASTLLGQSQSVRVQQLCGAVISVVGQLRVENSGEFDWMIISSPLIAMLLSSDDVISNVGKNSITILLERNENVVTGILQVIISPIITMNIFQVLDSLLTIANDKIPRNPKLIEVLQKIQKEGRTNAIKQKAKFLLLILQSESNKQKDGQIEIEINEQIKEMEFKLIEEQKKRIDAENKFKQFGQETEDQLRSINVIYDKPELKQYDWIEMKNGLEIVESGTEIQKEEIRKKKIETCQKIVAVFIGKKNNEGKKLAIESGIIDSLLHLLMTIPLENITLSHIYSLFIFTYKSNDEIELLLISKNPYQSLLRLFEHPNIFIVNRAVASIFNILNTGSNITAASQLHPHFADFQSCDGINKLFSLFKRNDITKYTKDTTARCIGHLFRAQEIPDKEMKTEISAHLKALLKDPDDWTKNSAKIAIKYLAQNADNREEIMKDINLDQIANNLKKKLDGNEEQQKQIKIQQDGDCWILAGIQSGRKDDELRRRIINSGIVDALINIFLTRDLNMITRAFSQLFNVLTNTNNEIKQSIYEKHPYPALIRLLNHPNIDVIDDSITSIYNIIITRTYTTSESEQYPHFTDMQPCDGIRMLFDLFKRNDITKRIKNITSRCLGNLFRAQQIPDKEMKTKIIAHLKALLKDPDDWEKYAAKNALKYLAQNAVNLAEIEKDGFVIPD
ncbi:MAG: hypothetical protein EZS28_004489 [Streblomastix strix]|uniref:Uncharacterized protein n=1 Tax=Streblomastix strix TaxID=222440 RepID=A0A5J4WYP4_9EUKA|nr:MAG: hypothetical protein EZS28_004489 [Streblomastix strix]